MKQSARSAKARLKIPTCVVIAFDIDFNFEACAGSFRVEDRMKVPLRRINFVRRAFKMIPNLRKILDQVAPFPPHLTDFPLCQEY